MTKSLTKTELEIMQYIWSVNSEVTAAEIREHFSDKNWSKQSVNSFIKKLSKEKFINIRRESLTKYYYSAALTEQEYSLLPARDILNELFKGSYSDFFCALLPPNVSDKDIRQLENLLAYYENKKG